MFAAPGDPRMWIFYKAMLFAFKQIVVQLRSEDVHLNKFLILNLCFPSFCIRFQSLFKVEFMEPPYSRRH